MSVAILKNAWTNAPNEIKRNAIDWENKKLITYQVEFYCHSNHKLGEGDRINFFEQQTNEWQNYRWSEILLLRTRYCCLDSVWRTCANDFVNDNRGADNVIDLFIILSFCLAFHVCVLCRLRPSIESDERQHVRVKEQKRNRKRTRAEPIQRNVLQWCTHTRSCCSCHLTQSTWTFCILFELRVSVNSYTFIM